MSSPTEDNDQLRQVVMSTEQGFADSMANRDFEAFQGYLADDTIFFAGDQPLRGKAAVAKAWQGFFSGPVPFSWEPKVVEVLDAGDLAISSGPVYDPAGKIIGVFNSIWRRQASGEWKIIFDKGGAAPPSD